MDAAEKSTILTVDDSALNLAMLNKILSPDYTLLTATTGAAALTLVPEKKPDLILLDVVMPGMSGFDVLKELKSNPFTAPIPVILITSLDSEEDEEKGFLLGAVDYIKKPFKNVIVKMRVSTHLQIVRQLRMNERLGMTDHLTEIPNKRSFDSRINAEWKRAVRDRQSIAFLMLDIDHFKNYNDTYGHLQGDVLLKTIASVFASSLKRSSDFVARLGGEEFGVLLPETNLVGALKVAETIRGNVESTQVPSYDGKFVTSVTVSIGAAATIPLLGDDPERFLAQADAQLYEAKESGRNRICPKIP